MEPPATSMAGGFSMGGGLAPVWLRADRHSEGAVPNIVDFRDPARGVLTAYEHRKHGKTPFAGRRA